jgi:hypothetical protein
VKQSDVDDAKAEELTVLTQEFAAYVKTPEQNKNATSSSSKPSRPLKRLKLALRNSSLATCLAS